MVPIQAICNELSNIVNENKQFRTKWILVSFQSHWMNLLHFSAAAAADEITLLISPIVLSHDTTARAAGAAGPHAERRGERERERDRERERERDQLN
jgi:hypothetical protein